MLLACVSLPRKCPVCQITGPTLNYSCKYYKGLKSGLCDGHSYGLDFVLLFATMLKTCLESLFSCWLISRDTAIIVTLLPFLIILFFRWISKLCKGNLLITVTVFRRWPTDHYRKMTYVIIVVVLSDVPQQQMVNMKSVRLSKKIITLNQMFVNFYATKHVQLHEQHIRFRSSM